jgi:hypothetical protein
MKLIFLFFIAASTAYGEGSGKSRHAVGYYNTIPEKKGKRRVDRSSKTIFRLSYAPQFISPVQYSSVTYDPPEATDTSKTFTRPLWKKAAEVTQQAMNFAVEIQPVSRSNAWVFGFRYHFDAKPDITDSDYIARLEFPYVNNKHQLKGYGLWINYGFLHKPLSDTLLMTMSTGLDFELSQLCFYSQQATEKDNVTYALASTKSEFLASSLRLQADFDAPLLRSSFGPTAGIVFYVPLTKFAKSFKGEVTDSRAEGNPDAMVQLQEALNHRTAQFAVELRIGAMIR